MEASSAVAGGVLLVLTLVSRQWIEVVFGVDPDHHNGSLEWFIVGLFFSVAAISMVMAQREWFSTRRSMVSLGSATGPRR